MHQSADIEGGIILTANAPQLHPLVMLTDPRRRSDACLRVLGAEILDDKYRFMIAVITMIEYRCDKRANADDREKDQNDHTKNNHMLSPRYIISE